MFSLRLAVVTGRHILGLPFTLPLFTNERLSADPQEPSRAVSEALCPPATCAWGLQILQLHPTIRS